MAVASLFASCDDDDFNTNSGTKVEFESATFKADENGGIFQIPVKVSGLRNGDVKFRVSTSETGANPAKEDVNYVVTSKTVSLLADSASNGTVYVEVKAIDDYQMNSDRTFNVTIEDVQGATLGANKTVTVTIADNDKSYYSLFGGQWRFSGKFVYKDAEGAEKTEDFSFPMTITAVSDTLSEDYEYRLNCLVNSFTSPHGPGTISLSFNMSYKYVASRNNGRIGILCSPDAEVYSVDQVTNHFGWTFSNYTTGSASTKEIVGRWTPTEDNSIPSEITFDEGSVLAYLETNLGLGFQYGDLMTDLKITRAAN